MSEVFALFDEIDAWLESELPEAMQWIDNRFSMRARCGAHCRRAEGQ